MIYSRATVDTERAPAPKMLGVFVVEVTGREPHDYVRTYRINAKSEGDAAAEALKKFEDEIEQLLAGVQT